MEATKKKSFWILVILIILAAIVVRIIWPAQRAESDANLLIVNNATQPIGSIGVKYTSLDGSLVSENALNADESLISNGETVYFQGVRWPAVVTVYKDVEGSELLTQLYIEQAPDAQCRWVATLYDSDEGISLSLESVPKEQK